VEDSAFEYRCFFPVLLLGAILWDPTRPISDLLTETALSPDAVFA
jgi:hypothetical protein